jgi:predicted PurR-regulated permease PerM
MQGNETRPESGYHRIYTIFFFVLAALLLGWASFKILRPFRGAIAWAIVLAVGFQHPGHALAARLGGMLGAIFRGSLLCALAQGLAGGVGWWIAGLPSPTLAGAAMAVLSLVPLGGTALVWIPGSLWLWSAGRHGMAIFLFLWGAIMVSFVADNILKPLLIRGSEELSTLVVFLGVFGGLAVFGLLGIFIGPIVLVLATGLLEVVRREAAATDAATAPAAESKQN